MLFPVLQVLRCYAADKGIRGIRVGQQRTDGQEYLRYGQRRTPVVLEDVQADHPLAVDVAVVDAGAEGHLRGLEGVLGREVDVQEEDPSLVGRAWGAQDGRHPLVEVVAFGASAAVGRGVQGDLGQLFLDPFHAGVERLRHFRGGRLLLLARVALRV